MKLFQRMLLFQEALYHGSPLQQNPMISPAVWHPSRPVTVSSKGVFQQKRTGRQVIPGLLTLVTALVWEVLRQRARGPLRPVRVVQ